MNSFITLSEGSYQAGLFDNEAAISRDFTIVYIDCEVSCFTAVIETLGDCDDCVAYPRFDQEAIFWYEELVVECRSSYDRPHWRDIYVLRALQTAISILICHVAGKNWNYLGIKFVLNLFLFKYPEII